MNCLVNPSGLPGGGCGRDMIVERKVRECKTDQRLSGNRLTGDQLESLVAAHEPISAIVDHAHEVTDATRSQGRHDAPPDDGRLKLLMSEIDEAKVFHYESKGRKGFRGHPFIPPRLLQWSSPADIAKRMKAHLNTIGQAQEAGRWTAPAGVFRDVTCVQLLNYICLLDDSLRDVLRDMSKAELINIALTAEPALSQEQVLKTLNAANQSWLDNLLEKSE